MRACSRGLFVARLPFIFQLPATSLMRIAGPTRLKPLNFTRWNGAGSTRAQPQNRAQGADCEKDGPELRMLQAAKPARVTGSSSAGFANGLGDGFRPAFHFHTGLAFHHDA